MWLTLMPLVAFGKTDKQCKDNPSLYWPYCSGEVDSGH